MQEAVGQNYVITWRQKASDVVFPHDAAIIRRDLQDWQSSEDCQS